MGIAKQAMLEEADVEQAAEDDEHRCPTCGDVMEEAGRVRDQFFVCGRCNDKVLEEDEDKRIAEAEDYIPGEFDAEELAEDKRIADAENGDLPQI